MKGKKLLTLLAALLMLAALAGCSAKSAGDMAANGVAAPEAREISEEDALYSMSDSGTMDPEALADRKLIKRVYIDAETEDMDTLLSQLNGKIEALGGYIENQEIYNGSAYSSRRTRYANLTIRIPAENLNGFVEQVKGVSNVVSCTQDQDDVTLTYVDTESRMNALRTEEARLLELMGQAETMSDLLEIEERLTEVRYELESVTSQMRVLENQVSYATVQLAVNQVKVYTEVEEQTVWQRIGTGFAENLRGIGSSLVDFFVWVVTYSPQLVIAAAAVALAVVLVKRSSKKRRAKRNGMPPQEPEDKA